MEKVKFLDEEFLHLADADVKSKRFVAWLKADRFHDCSKGIFAVEEVNVYMSAVPFAKNLTLEEAYVYVAEFREKNPNCLWARLVAADEIAEFNSCSEQFDFKIERAKTSSVYTDWHGRIDARYCWDNGVKCDDGIERSDVYLHFVLKATAPQKVVL